MSKFSDLKQVVVILAHPDDAELSCFGTLLKYCEQGYKVNVIIVCSGERGVSLADSKQQGIKRLDKALRYQESVAAFSNTSIMVECLNYEDGKIILDTELISSVEKRLQELQPKILITHWVKTNGFEHQDHVVIGQACLNASLRCHSIQLILQTEPLHAIKNQFIPNYFVNISDYFEQKMYALSQHKSQIGRVYLTEEFHLLKARQNALTAGIGFYEQNLLFESFIATLHVEL